MQGIRQSASPSELNSVVYFSSKLTIFFEKLFYQLCCCFYLLQEPHHNSGIPGEFLILSTSSGFVLCAGFTGKNMVD